jgi:hypothetical protein
MSAKLASICVVVRVAISYLIIITRNRQLEDTKMKPHSAPRATATPHRPTSPHSGDAAASAMNPIATNAVNVMDGGGAVTSQAPAPLCTLRRCQGIRGCICPRGKIPVGCYGKGDAQIDSVVEVSKKSSSPNKANGLASKAAREKSVSPVRPKSASVIDRKPAQIAAEKVPAAKPTAAVDTESKAVAADIPAVKRDDASSPAGLAPSSESPSINGSLMIRYNHYKKEFPVVDGIVLKSAIDDEYCLSFAYPHCKLHVSETSPAFLAQQDDNSLSSITLIPEDAAGNFLFSGLGVEYWVHIEEDEKEKEEYEKRAAVHSKEVAERRAREEADGANAIVKTKTESCSCIEGNPCVDRYCCKDWDNRYTVAKQNGWKGFQ